MTSASQLAWTSRSPSAVHRSPSFGSTSRIGSYRLSGTKGLSLDRKCRRQSCRHPGILQTMMCRHFVSFRILFMKPDPPAFAVLKIVLDVHPDNSANPPSEKHIAAINARSRNSAIESPGMLSSNSPPLRRRHGRLAGLDDVLRAPDRSGGVHGHDLADHEPIKEHPQGREVLLDRGAALAARSSST